MSFKDLDNRVTPASYGKPVDNSPLTQGAPYMGEHLSAFFVRQGIALKDMRYYLRRSRIGSVYELPQGRRIEF